MHLFKIKYPHSLLFETMNDLNLFTIPFENAFICIYWWFSVVDYVLWLLMTSCSFQHTDQHAFPSVQNVNREPVTWYTGLVLKTFITRVTSSPLVLHVFDGRRKVPGPQADSSLQPSYCDATVLLVHLQATRSLKSPTRKGCWFNKIDRKKIWNRKKNPWTAVKYANRNQQSDL